MVRFPTDHLSNNRVGEQKCSFKVSCVIPALNENGTIRQVIRCIQPHVDEVIVVDGHSNDGTLEAAVEEGAHVFIQRGKGKGAALREGFDRATGDVVIMMDADGSMKAGEIPGLVNAILSGADVVKGSRFLERGNSEDLTPLRRMGNLALVRLVNLLWSSHYTDLCYGFKAFRKEALRRLNLNLQSDEFEIETEICIKSHKMGMRVEEVPSIEHKRTYGRSHLSAFSDGLKIVRAIARELIGTS